ncbi:MAG TPA: hypothetical protein VGH18_00305 [Gaiellaceae bacterium]
MAMRRGVLLVPAVAVALLFTGCGGASRSDYVARNEAIAKSLPIFPGAVKTQQFSTPNDANGEFSAPSGYTTTLVYRVLRGTRGAAVVRFYESRLHRRGWQLGVALGNTRRVRRSIARFTRDRAFVAVDALLLAPLRERYVRWAYEIVIDYRGAGTD